MDLKALKAKRAEHVAAAKAINDGAKALKVELSAEQLAEMNKHLDEAEGYTAKINDAEAASNTFTRLETIAGEIDKSTGRKTAPDTNTVAGGTASAVVVERWKEDPKKGFKSHKDFLLAVMAKGKGARLDADTNARLDFLATAGSDEQKVASNVDGGFLVPEGFSPQVLQLTPEPDPMAGRTRMIPMGSPVVRIPARTDKDHSSSVSGGLTVSRKAETVAGATSKSAFEQVVLESNSLFGGAYCSEELLTDSPQSFAAIVASGFTDQFTYHLINERLNGTGVGEFQGIANSPALISVSKETGQAAATIVYANIIKMRARCWGYSQAVWMANHDTIPQLTSLNQAVGTGGQLVYAPSAREDVPDMLLGRPIIFTEFCKTVGTTGDLVLANWNEYLEGVYQPLQSAESIHVRFLNNERTYKFWLRNAGAGWWRTALTPKNGSTLSPFVYLATRS